MYIQEAIAARGFDPKLLQYSEGRRLLTRNDPLLFAAIYLPHKLKVYLDEPMESISINQFHEDICDYALLWTNRLSTPRKHRDCFIAPRMCGKSTWIFHILPIWAAAHMHKRYIIAFSDSESQAIAWLLNFKMELDSNALLQQDYPELCELYKKGDSTKAYMDNRNATRRANGFVFQAKGADASVLGANIGGMRPEVILFDDIEPTESNYGPTDLQKRKQTLLTSHFYLNINAFVVFVGTTTMPNSLLDQMRKVGELRQEFDGEHDTFKGEVDPEMRWVVEENIQTHYYPAILTGPDGEEESLWPEKWPMEELNEARGTRSFALNMMNKPVSGEEGYWDDEDLVIDRTEYGNTVLSIDPAVTTARRSDYTALSVISKGLDGKLYVRHAEQLKGDSDAIVARAGEIAEEYGIGITLVETNQGGDLWKQVFKDFPYRVRYLHQKVKKEIRIAQAADYYKKKKVLHTAHFPALEEQMLAYPNVQHDDLVDCVASAVLYFAKSGKRVTARQFNYMEER